MKKQKDFNELLIDALEDGVYITELPIIERGAGFCEDARKLAGDNRRVMEDMEKVSKPIMDKWNLRYV